MLKTKLLLLAGLLLTICTLPVAHATLGGHATAVTLAKNVPYDSRGFPAFFKVNFPTTLNFNAGDTCSYQLNTYGAAGDKNVTASAVWGSIAPTISSTGTKPTGMTLDTSNLNNAFLTCTPLGTGAGASGQFTLDFDNSVGTPVSATVSWTVLSDTTPDPFNFIDQSNVATTTTITSNAITISGLSAATTSAVTVSGATGTWSKNGGAFSNSAGTVVNGDTVQVRHTSSGSNATAVNTTLTIGGVSDTFTSITGTPADTQPNPFSFNAVAGVVANTVTTSNTISITGITAAATTTVSGGTWSKNGGAFTASAGSVVNNDTVAVRLTASGVANTATSATLTVGGVTGTFTVTTIGTAQSLVQGSGGPNFYVKAGGNDSLDGKSDTTAWGTLTKASSVTYPAGSSLWLKGGSTFQNQLLNVTLNGTGANGTATVQAVLGSYYTDAGGAAYVNSPTNYSVSRRPSTYTYAVPRPKILGTYHPSCRNSNLYNTSANKCAWNTAASATDPTKGTTGTGAAFPSAFQAPSSTVSGKYFAVQDLDLEDSAGVELNISTSAASGANPGYCFWDSRCDLFAFIQRNKVGHTAGEGITLHGTHVVVRQNEVFLTILRYADRPTGFNVGAGSGIAHTACDPCYALDEGNDIWGVAEAIGNYGVSFILERGNWIGSSSRSGTNHNLSASIVTEQNIIVGGTADSVDPLARTAAPDGGNETGAMFWPMGFEGGFGPYTISSTKATPYGRILTGDQADSKNVQRNNVVQTNTALCSTQYLSALGDSQAVVNMQTQNVGNTCFTDHSSIDVEVEPQLGADVAFYKDENDLIVVASNQECFQSTTLFGKMINDYNQWTILQAGPQNSGANCRGAHDVVSATTGLPTAFNWHTASWLSFPAESDFLPNTTIASNGLGLAMNGAMFTYSDSQWGHTDQSTGDPSWWSWVLRQRVWLPACNTTGAQVSETEWDKLLTTDYCGNTRTTMTPGARVPQ